MISFSLHTFIKKEKIMVVAAILKGLQKNKGEPFSESTDPNLHY